tara:strand:- start:273 stop:686 length:414 start_codon:yes stop_codon:yes gene_type:complete
MKITKSQLKQIIKEELEAVLENKNSFPVDQRELEKEANKLELARGTSVARDEHSPTDRTIDALMNIVGDNYMVVDYRSDEGMKQFTDIEQGNIDLPDGTKGAIIIIPNRTFATQDGNLIVHYKTIRSNKYGRAVLPR